MADVQSNIKVSIDTTEALASIKNLQRQISAFHTSMAKGGAAANAVTSQMQQNLINSVNATGKFSAQMRTIKTTTESFTSSLEKNKFSMGEYFRYAGGASKSFGRLFKTEFETINKVARENVKDLQTQYIKMGRDANGAMKAIAVRPLSLDMNNLATKTMVAAQKQAILNQLLKQGSTNLLNFGKNTQWAGRQLMVGFTIPLMALGAAASKTFMDMETQAIRFKKVYGDLFTSTTESTAALDAIKNLGKEFTKYGIAVADTVGLASEAAAAGFKGVDLQRQTAAATRLSILGQVESQKALETTIALQNAFSMSSEDLAKNIDFLNAVENQTVLSLDDMSTAIPKAAPVIQQLGGDVKDLAFFMAAMKEGGINASEGANALKSGLASMINPTGKASAMLEGFGINIKKIVVDNKGDLKKTVTDFATALNKLDPLNRAQAIEQMFGKFQFARLSTLFANVTKEGTQASRVLDLAGASIQELAALSEKELGQTSESAMNKFKSSIEQLKLSLVPLGEQFLKVITPIAEFITKVLDKFNSLGDGTKKIIVVLTAVVAGLGPVLLMTFGLLMNGLANIIKGFTFLKSIFNKAGRATGVLGNEVKYMTTEQRNAAAVASSLDQVHRNLAQTFSSEAAAVDALTRAYYRAVAAQSQFMPIRVPLQRGSVTKRAKGKPARVGGTGNQDTELALLMPGETVIPTKMSKKYGGLINGMIADNIPGYMSGKSLAFAHASMPFSPGSTQYAEGIKIAGLEGLVKVFPQWIKVVSNLVAEIPQALNVKMKTGTGIGEFEKDYASRTGKFLSSGILGGIDPTNKNEIAGLQKLEDAIGKRAVALAKGTKEQLVTDDLFAKATREVIDENVKLKGSTGRAAKALDTVSKQVGQVRVSATQQGLREGLKSGLFRRTRKSTQTQNQIMFDNVNVGRESSSSPNTFYSANPITPRGSYRSAKKRSISVIQPMALSDAAAYNETIEKNTEDIYVKSRKRKSPHSLAPKDGKDDARAYNRAVDKELTRGGKKRRVAFRPQGPAPIIPANVSTQIIPPIIPSGYVPPEGPMYGPRTPTKYDKTVGKVAGKFRSSKIARLPKSGLGMGLSSALMMGSTMIPGKTGDIIQKVSMVAFSLSALQPVVSTLILAFGTAAVAIGAGVAAAVVGIGLAMYLFSKSSKKSAEDIKEAAKRESEARIGSARAVEQFAKTFNKALPSEREFSRSNSRKIKASGGLVDQYAKDYATEGNISTGIINQAAKKGQVEGINAIAIDVANKAAILGLSPEEIAAMVKAASRLIGADEVSVTAKIQKLLAPGGKDILKEPLTIDARLNYLNKQSAPIIKNLDKSINEISKIQFDQVNPLPGAESFNYKSLQSAAGEWSSIKNSWKGDFWDKALAAGKVWTMFQKHTIKSAITPSPLGPLGNMILDFKAPSAVESYNDVQTRIQDASTKVSIAFMQQKEALALLDAQYADGQISQEEYNRQKQISRNNIDSLEKSSIKLVKQLNKIDTSGDSAAGVIKDLANQSLAVLKAANPDKFNEITKAISALPDDAEVGIYMGYTRGSLTLMDLAILPQLLQQIQGQEYTVAINLIMGSGLSEGGEARFAKQAAEAKLRYYQQIAASLPGPDRDIIKAISYYQSQITEYDRIITKIENGIDQKGKLDTDLDGYQDLENGTDGAMTATERYLEVLDKEIDALKAKRDAQKDANDEIQREIDLKNKLEDLQKQSIDAKISGDYIKSAMLAQEANQLKMKYDQETELKKKDDEIARLEARYNAIKDGANLTALEKSRIPVVKKANGGAVKGFNTGGHILGAGTATSDSIPAYLSNGEYVIKADSVKKYGTETFDALNAGKYADGGIIQGFRTGGLNRVASGFAKKMAFAIPNKINEIKNYLKVRSMIKDGMWHGSQPTGSRGEEYLQGKNILDGAETYDPHYGMGFFGTSSKSEADMYAAGYNSSSNWGEAFGSINKITKAPFGKYVDFTRGTNSIKWQNYKLYQALGMEKDGYLNSYLPENLGDIMAGQNVTGSIMKRISDGQVPGDMGSAKWLAWSKPAGVHTEEYTGGRYAPKKPASLLDNLKSKFSLLNKKKGFANGGLIQKFSTGSPGGVKPGAISKAGLMKANAKAGAMWQAMEEIEKGLSLKYGANPNSSGLEKWSKALGRVAFNTLQGGVSGAVAAPSPWAVLTGAVAGLAEGLYGIGTEGSQYGVKGGKYATPKGAKTRRFNPKEQLDNMNLMSSAGNIAMSGAFSSVLGMLPFKRMAEGIGKIVPKSVKNFGTNAKESIQSKLSSANNIKIGNPLKSDKLKNLIVAAMIGFQKPFLGNSSSSVLPNFSLNKTSIVDEINKKIGNYSVNKVRFGDSLHKQYNIQHAKKPIVFQGHTEDLSNVTGDADIVSTSNIGILSKALEMKPGDKHLEKMLDNFKAGPLALGQDEKLFLDRKAASIGVSDTLEVLPTENTDGLALFLSSLIGDQEAANLVTAKQNVLYASIVKNKQKIIESRIKNPHISNTEPVDLSTVPLIHSTPYPVIREADNSVKIYPAGHHNLNDVDLATGLSHSYPRTTVHLGAESSVANVIERVASKTQTRVIGKASDMVDRNGLPENFIPTDVYYVRDVGQSLDFSNPAIIKDFVDKTLYTETLIREGLLLPGQKPKVLTVDPNKNNLYLLKKPTYNQTDRKTIQKFIDDNSDLMRETSGSAGIRVPFSNTAGNEEVILDKIAIQLAKKKLGINTSYIGQSGPETLNYLPRNNEYAAFAQKHNLGFEFHAGTDLSMAEKQMIGGFGSGSHITLGGTGVDTYSKAQQAYIESVRMQMMHNSTKTNIKRLDKMDEEELLEKGYTHKKVGYQIPPIVEWRSAFPKGDPNYGEIVTKEQQTLNYLADIEKAAKKKRPGAASGGLITQRGLINQKAISTRYNLPSFATGIDYLPNDMIAQLHQGERVLTKEENKTYSSSAPTTNIININGSDLNKKEIAQAVMVELDRAKNKNNKTNMVGR